jgi:hypothetical protein
MLLGYCCNDVNESAGFYVRKAPGTGLGHWCSVHVHVMGAETGRSVALRTCSYRDAAVIVRSLLIRTRASVTTNDGSRCFVKPQGADWIVAWDRSGDDEEMGMSCYGTRSRPFVNWHWYCQTSSDSASLHPTPRTKPVE